MKNFYFFILVLITHISFSQNFTDAKGELQISDAGAAVYKLPIAMPPSIKNTAPILNLTYSSGVRGGIAGQGWSISGIGAVSRTATRMDIDGYIDGVDFDADDKLVLDGQRLLKKTGDYWAPGSTYETEYKSNTKIELKIEGVVLYFVVTAPDGSRSWYGSKGSGNLQNAVSSNSWYIVRYEDVYGNSVNYNYKTVSYNNTSQLYIDTITFSGNESAGIASQNKVKFNYEEAMRVERDYVKGAPFYATQLLDNIEVYAGTALFRTYQLIHTTDTPTGYQRVASIKEINGQQEESNPINFTYATSPLNQQRTEKTYTNNLLFDKTDAAGDFDGDGSLDFIIQNKLYTKLFQGDSGNAPITMPVWAMSGRTFAATTVTNGKVNQQHSIIDAVPDLNSITFNYYNFNNQNVSLVNTKSIPIANPVYNEIQCSTGGGGGEEQSRGVSTAAEYPEMVNLNNEYLEGDFNGDGLSDVIILQYHQVDHYGMDGPCTGPHGEALNCNCIYKSSSISNCAINVHFLNLDPSASTTLGSKDFLYMPDFNYCKEYENKWAADFNGDGKTDFLFINNTTKNYRIVSIRQLTAAPWYALEVLGSGVVDQYSKTKQLLLGDYNGDGKTDIMLPTSEGGEGQTQWNIYYSNPNPSGGEFFAKEIQNIVEYWPDTETKYKTQRHFSSYFAMDINKDGKSDVVRVWRKYFKDDWSINNHDTQWQVTGFANNIGKLGGSGFNLSYDSGVFTSNSPDIPIPVPSNYKYNGANTDLIVIRGHYNQIEYYQFNKNVDTENRLIGVTEAGGNISQTIEYRPMAAVNESLGNAASDFYSSENAALYPNIEIIKNTTSYLVSKLTAVINGVPKYQDFRYRGFVSNYNYGTVGFKKTSRSSWYLSESDTKIWTTQSNDINLRGANTITWTSTDASTTFNGTPSGLLSTKTNVFSTYTNPISKVYNVLLDSQTTIDALSGVKSENLFSYDGTVNSPAYYGLETKSVTNSYSSGVLQGTKTVNRTYTSNPNGNDNYYYIGRPDKEIVENHNAASNDTRKSEAAYFYTGFDLTSTEKKGHNTYAIIENMTYDGLGNLLTKTVSAPGAPSPPAARTITDQYDTTKRFVVKKTDHQGFTTDYTYNNLGQVTHSTDYMGITSDFIYDNWGKLTSSTVSNSTLIPLMTTTAYAKLGSGGYTVTTTSNLDSKTVVEFDVLGRTVKNSIKGFGANTMVTKAVVYDGLGRKLKESEPYISSPSLWTTYEYDYLMRTKKIIAPTGKVQSFVYSVLTTTSNDDGKVSTTTMDALGNKVQSTDPGGIINFTYFATGQMKKSEYDGNEVTVNIDGWGNKISLSDPSAGVYTYSYDAFGQLKTETTPNGTTSFDYDQSGKITQKTTSGPATSNTTTYQYNSYNQLTNSTFTDIESKSTTTVYNYDSYKRLYKTTESTPYAVFTKELTFDSLGRIDKETSTASHTSSGKTSNKVIKKTYKNGFPWQIIDDESQQVLWQINSINERGQLLTAALGNEIAVTNNYDQYGYVTQIRHDKTGPVPVNIMTLNTDFEIKRGNLNSRTNSLFGRNETFKYDNLDRLTEFTNGLGIQESQIYDDTGRITQNSVGIYEYDGTKTYQNKAIVPTPEALGYYGNREGIFNDSMEDQNGWGPAAHPNNSFYTYDITKAHSGKTSLKLTNTTTTEQYVHSDKWITIDNAADTEYTFSGWVYLEGPSAELVFFMKKQDEAGYLTHADARATTVNNQWVKLEGTFLVPSYIKKLNIRVDNNGYGNAWFDDLQIRKTSDAPTSARQLNVTYNTFKDPIQIEETGIDKISFEYNENDDRSSMFYGGQQADKLQRTYRKHSAAGGSMEIKHNTVTGAVEFVTYIGGNGYSAPVVLKSDGVTQNYLYLHRDYQGTIVAISDQSGAVVEKRLFDAWGKIIKVEDGAGNILNGLTVLDRGYTGHEHLLSVGLIHMNGRLYDPKLHRFMQPDNFVQEPDNTQNYNKYAYVFNNPLKYTDPSGEYVEIGILGAIGIGMTISALTYTITALVADVPFTAGGLAKATYIGAATSVVTYGIGSAAGSLFTNFFSQAAFQAVAHGTFQGTMTAVSGGKFWSGFAAGALSSIASSAWSGGSSMDEFGSYADPMAGTGMTGIGSGTGDLGMIAFGTVSGGLGAKLTGGNFWEGAVTGLFVSLLNHTVHRMTEFDQIDPPVRPDADGKITLAEANYWYRNGHGEPLYADLSKIDLSFVSASDFKKVGEVKTFQSLFKSEDGFVYGNITLKYEGGTRVTVSKGYYDTYNFETHGNRSTNPSVLRRIGQNTSRAFRNFATVGGRMLADRFPMRLNNQEFNIYFYGVGKISK